MKRTLALALILLALSLGFSTPHRAAASDAPAAPAMEPSTVHPDLCFGFGASSSLYNSGGGSYSFACNSGCLLFQGSNNAMYYGNVCPGPAAVIALDPAPTAVSCASTSSISATVTDKDGYDVADDTAVSFATDLGSISASGSTTAGRVVASLTLPVKTVGQAHVSVTTGSIAARRTIDVTC